MPAAKSHFDMVQVIEKNSMINSDFYVVAQSEVYLKAFSKWSYICGRSDNSSVEERGEGDGISAALTARNTWIGDHIM